MLKYQLNKQVFGNDLVTLDYGDINISDYTTPNNDRIMVELECSDTSAVEAGDVLSYATALTYYNDDLKKYDYIGDSGKTVVQAVNHLTNMVYFIDNKYMELEISDIYAEIEDSVMTWVIEFENTHLFGPFDLIDIYLVYDSVQEVRQVHLSSDILGLNPDMEPSSDNPPINSDLDTNLKYDNYFRIKWVYDENVENASELLTFLFGSVDTSHDGIVESNGMHVTCLRNQARWTSSTIQSSPTVIVSKYKVNLTVPISLKTEVCLYSEGNLKEYFVEHEEQKAINGPIEMEKVAYTPVIVTYESSNNNPKPIYTYTDCIKINFNLHFRVHDGNDWTVDDSDSWNFEKYGDGNERKYYSYGNDDPINGEANSWLKRSCQSDLLGYAGFVTNDVKYQKNKLKKSFLRLFYYDSDNPATQTLLGYSTLFVDSNKLYSKFISKMNFNCYYDDNWDIVKGIKVNREVDETMLESILGSRKRLSMGEVEDARLSSQITVKNSYLSDNSSEGFYLYKWEDENENNSEDGEDIFMRVEFNHAGYGRNIPMMAPYEMGTGFKTNDQIINDWNVGGYGIRKYTRYSYIRLKSKIITEGGTRRHIYFLDPLAYNIKIGENRDKKTNIYGNPFVDGGNIININLYEARISFSDNE